MKILVALIALAITGTAYARDKREGATALSGTFTTRKCPTDDYYAEAYPTLLLDQPLTLPSHGRVDAVEIALPEKFFVTYQAMEGRHGSVICRKVETSMVCGPDNARAFCGVSDAMVDPE